MPTAREGLSIKLLGEFRLTWGDELVTTVNTSRLQSLLGYLLIHRHAPQPRRHVAFLFWPDTHEAQAQSNFRNLLMSLRRSFPHFDDFVLVERHTIQWRGDSAFELDVAGLESALDALYRFEHLDHSPSTEGSHALSPQYMSLLHGVVDLYSGDLLPSCYDEWIAGPREQLHQGFLATLEKLAYALETAGELGQAILYAQQLLRHDTLREENYRGLMSLHLANGDPAGAISVYRHCVRVLKRDLDMEPSRMTTDLAREAEALSRTAKQQRRRAAAGGVAGKAPAAVHATLPINLPAQTTSFVGREREALQLSELLRREGVRLVTVTGAAGTGKTRLAIEVASALAASHAARSLLRDGVYFVSLAPVDDPALVERAIAQALGVTEESGQTLRSNLMAHLQEKRLLLLLDNFEHLLLAAKLVGDLLGTCPGIRVLVTSRATLNLRGEHEYALPTMAVPGRDMPAQPEDLLQFESVALFLMRAMEAVPDFSLTRENARPLAEICRRLDGLPLAIELAATRVKVLSPDAILSRLDRRLRLLVGGRQDMPSRQQALETAIMWSYDLLDHEGKALFRRLSIFAGGFTLQAAEEVLASLNPEKAGQDATDVLDGITSLVNKSLLVRSELTTPIEEVRFSMLESLREYGLERMEENGETGSVARRHALYYVELAEASARELMGSHQVQWMQTVQTEHDNIRTGLRWAIKVGQPEIALRLAGPMGRFWEIHGYLSEGRSWLRAALDLKAERVSAYRALALYSYGSLAVRQRDYDAAKPVLEECRDLYRELGDKQGVSNALNTLAVMSLDRDYEEALALHEESLALRREISDRTGIATSLHNIAFIKMHQGKWDEAYALAAELQSTWHDLGSVYGEARTGYLLGMIASGQGKFQLGQQHLEECLDLCRQLADDWLAAWALHGLGEILYLGADYARATEVFTRAQRLFSTLGDDLGAARTLISLGREAYRTASYTDARRLFREALEIGRKLDNHIVIGCCLAGFAGLAGTRGELRLSARLFGCASDLLQTESTNLERCAMTLNMEDLHAALDLIEPHAWQAAWCEGAEQPWEQSAALAPTIK